MLPILFAFIGLALGCASVEFWRRSRWLDRLALVAFVILSIGTQPSSVHHRIAVANSIKSSHASPGVTRGSAHRAEVAASVSARLEHRTRLVFSLATLDGKIVSVGMFGRVFVRDG